MYGLTAGTIGSRGPEVVFRWTARTAVATPELRFRVVATSYVERQKSSRRRLLPDISGLTELCMSEPGSGGDQSRFRRERRREEPVVTRELEEERGLGEAPTR
jgi:hypothetical protein